MRELSPCECPKIDKSTQSNDRFTMNPATIITLALALRFACQLIAAILRTL
jgi:hypothetical protein